jgi:hypothetical protein
MGTAGSLERALAFLPCRQEKEASDIWRSPRSLRAFHFRRPMCSTMVELVPTVLLFHGDHRGNILSQLLEYRCFFTNSGGSIL